MIGHFSDGSLKLPMWKLLSFEGILCIQADGCIQSTLLLNFLKEALLAILRNLFYARTEVLFPYFWILLKYKMALENQVFFFVNFRRLFFEIQIGVRNLRKPSSVGSSSGR
jgi:hypothetical protein